MFEKVNLKYQSIIINEHNQKEVIKYHKEGHYKIEDDSYELIFNLEENYHVHLLFSKEEVILKYGNNCITMRLDQKIENLYHTMYGQIPLDFHLKKYNFKNNHFKIVYELYQNTSIISKIYLTILISRIN